MAEAAEENIILDTGTRIKLVKQIFRLIKDNSLDKIKNILEALKPEQRIKVLLTSINGFIPLYVAVNHNNVEISRYLLKLSGRREMSERWKTCRHPLNAAISQDNPKLVKLILQPLQDINENINGVHSPLMIATLLEKVNSVKLLVQKGADIHRSYVKGRTPLMESVSNSTICEFLLGHGANVNHQDIEGFTALHLAVGGNHKESVELLVNAGADVRPRNKEGITPLIWASINMNKEIIMYLAQNPAYFELDRIEALEILNVSYILAQKSDLHPWMEALRGRNEANLLKNCQIGSRRILDFSREFGTQTELENLKGDPLRLAYQCILVVDRIIGKNNRFYLQILLQTAMIARKVNDWEKVKQFIDFIDEYCQETSVFSLAANVSSFQLLFRELGKSLKPEIFFENGGFSLFKIIAKAAMRMWVIFKSNCSEIIDTFLYMTSVLKARNVSQLYFGLIREVVTEVVREDIRVLTHQSVLHRAIKLMKIKTWSTVELLKVLLESGVDPNSEDDFQQTPILYAVKNVPEHIRNDVLTLLTEYGAVSIT